MLKVGVVGLGWMGRVHLRNYTEMSGVEVVGVVDVDPKALEEVSAQFGVDTYRSLDELLEARPGCHERVRAHQPAPRDRAEDHREEN